VVADSRSDRALASALRELMLDDARRLEYGRRARVVAVERFEWNRLAAQLSRELATFDHFRADF
jgi:glycosyltransferase involved in cell wall biosynthesis